MSLRKPPLTGLLCLFIVFAAASLQATIVPPLTLHELVTKSSQILIGRVVGSSTSWGSEHKYIWTRYRIAVGEVIKGEQQKTVIVSEPGGTLDGTTMRIAGAVTYSTGERVALFLETYPSGDKRTVGWGQGKVTLDSSGKALPGSFRELSGLGETAFRLRIQKEIGARSASARTSK